MPDTDKTDKVMSPITAKNASAAPAEAEPTEPREPAFDPEEYERLLDMYDVSFRNFAEGEVVRGVVLRVSDTGSGMDEHVRRLNKKFGKDALFVVPVGLVVAQLPVSPGGIGVGHVGFYSLFALVGSRLGADVFSLYVVLHFVSSLPGLACFFALQARPRPRVTGAARATVSSLLPPSTTISSASG